MKSIILKTINTYLFRFNSYIPILSITILYLFLISCIIDLGHYPLHSINDPKEIGLSFLYYISGYGFFAVLYSSIIWLINLVIGIYYKEVSIKHLIIFTIGLAIYAIQIIYDPGKILYWYFD